jgi:hypothetical protein
VQGPRCERDSCEHDSCTRAWAASVRNAGYVDRPAREDRGPVDWGRSERLWVARNTAEAWAHRIDEQRGNAPRPQRRPRSVPVTTTRERIIRCEYSDLPVGQCACARCSQPKG